MAATKIIYYVGGCSLAGYLLLKLVERDPETLRKKLPEGKQIDYETEAQKRNALFMCVLKNAAAGDDPEVAARKAREMYQEEQARKAS